MSRRSTAATTKSCTSTCAPAALDFNIPSVSSYHSISRTVLQTQSRRRGPAASVARCAFNVMARNCDDHTKNLSFTMDKAGT